MRPSCARCHGWTYADLTLYPKTVEWFCLMCGDVIYPNDFTPLPYLPRYEEPSFKDNEWHIDEHGDIVDIIDKRIEDYVKHHETFTVSAVAKKINCSISEARMTLARLIRNNVLETYQYGPLLRWQGFRRI